MVETSKTKITKSFYILFDIQMLLDSSLGEAPKAVKFTLKKTTMADRHIMNLNVIKLVLRNM